MRFIIVLGLLVTSVGTVDAQTLKRLPFPDGTYVTNPDLCRMTPDQQTAKFGDSVGSMVRNIEGRKLDNGYELSCQVASVMLSGAAIKFKANCESEGEPNTVNGSWMKVDEKSFKIGSRTFTACGRLIR